MIWSNILELLINFKLEFATLAWTITPFGPYGFYKQVNNLGQLEFKSLKIASINNGALCYETDNEVVVFIGNTLPPNSNNDIYLADTPEDVANIPTAGLNAGDLVYIISTESYQSWDGDSWEDYTPGEPLTPPLADVLDQGNTSGLNDIVFDEFYGLQFNNNSRLREGTIDAGLGGSKGIAQICGAGYELKWEAGRLYVMGSSGNTIRQSLYNFNNIPTATDDSDLGYTIGSLWTLDDGTTYECIDATPASANWIESSQSKFIEVTKAQLLALEGAGTLTLNVWYRVTDALANTAKILVSALSTSVVSKAAVNLTDNSFGQYTLSSDTYVPISGGSGIPKATASGTDTYTATISGVTSYTDGDAYLIRFTNGNTDTSTLNIYNGTSFLGAKTLYANTSNSIIGGDIWAGSELLCIYNSTLNGFQCIGTSPNSLYAYVVNADSVAITRGQPVYAFGSTGNRMSVKLANNQSDGTSAQTYGLVYSSSIAAGQKGIIIIQGVLSGLNLGGTWADGDAVYLGNTAGAITKTKPTAPEHLVYLGVVERANAGNGIMYVRVQNGYELDEIHDVSITTPTNNQGLIYENSSQLWKNKTIDKTLVGLGNVDNTSDANKPISSATQTALNAKQNTITGGATTITASDLTALRALVSDASGKVAVSTVTSVTLAFLDATSSIQTQLNGKRTSANSFRRPATSDSLNSTDLATINSGSGLTIEMDVTSTANTLTIPLHSSVAFPIGTEINVVQRGTGQTTIAGPGVTLNSSGNWLKLASRYSACTLVKVANNEWYVFGQLAP